MSNETLRERVIRVVLAKNNSEELSALLNDLEANAYDAAMLVDIRAENQTLIAKNEALQNENDDLVRQDAKQQLLKTKKDLTLVTHAAEAYVSAQKQYGSWGNSDITVERELDLVEILNRVLEQSRK